MDLFEELFHRGRPVRRNAAVRVTVNRDGDDTLRAAEGEFTTYGDDGSLDTLRVDVESFHGCGCSATLVPAAGQCAEPGCRQVSCQQCFQNARCEACDKPLCLEHTYQLEDDDGRALGRYCKRCYSPRSRKRRSLAIARAILRPFHEDLKRIK